MERIFDLDPQLLQDAIILAINVFILFILLSYMLFNPVRDMLKKRQDSIQGNIDKALSDKDEAEKMKAMYEEKLKNAAAFLCMPLPLPAAVPGQTFSTRRCGKS